jgi:hypothetical protein
MSAWAGSTRRYLHCSRPGAGYASIRMPPHNPIRIGDICVAECPPGNRRAGDSCVPDSTPEPPPGSGQPTPPGDQPTGCPPGQIAWGNVCVDPRGPGGSVPPPADRPPPFGDFTRPDIGIVRPPPFCQGGPFKLIGGTCCAGQNYTCTIKPATGSCPSGTEAEFGQPWSAYPVCCQTDRSGIRRPQQERGGPRCEPVGETREERCWRWYGPNPVSTALCIYDARVVIGGSVLCFSNRECGEGSCCNRDGACVAAPATDAPRSPAVDDSCQPPAVRVAGRCTCPEGQSREGDRCVPACTGGRVWSGESCVCSGSMVWNGRACVPPEKKPPGCGKGLRWDGKKCVPVSTKPKCKSGQRWDGKRCRPISQPQSTPRDTPKAPGFGIEIGIGGGIGPRGPRGPGRPSPPPFRPN